VLTTPIEHRAGRRLTADERTADLLHAATRVPAERGSSVLEATVEALRQVLPQRDRDRGRRDHRADTREDRRQREGEPLPPP